ncbi:MAG: hypothetical protein K8F30_10025 [Taibaiella sp.]|nr:hypothetical protein [Taibaiella sp.]
MKDTEHNLDKTPKDEDNIVLTPKTIDIFSAFAVTLKRIHIRLIAEGYIIKDGEISKSERLLSYEQDNTPPQGNR